MNASDLLVANRAALKLVEPKGSDVRLLKCLEFDGDGQGGWVYWHGTYSGAYNENSYIQRTDQNGNGITPGAWVKVSG